MRFLVLLVALTCVAGADVSVTVRTEPPGARISIDRRGLLPGEAPPEVGVSNGPPVVLPVDTDKQSSISLILEHPLCLPQTITITDLKGLEGGLWDTWPKEGTILLKYRSPYHRLQGFLRSWAAVLTLLGVVPAAVVLAVVARARSAQRQARQVEARAREITDLVVPTAGEDLLLGRSFDGYLLVERLGQGGMATVYRALPEDRVAVALKILDPELGRDDDFVRRFEREKNVYGELVHPNIVGVYGYGSFQEHYYLVLELIDGTTLREVMPDGVALTPTQALQYLRPLLQALAFAHSKGIVHRDLKPENIMLTREGRLKVMDFGMARGAHNQTLTATGALLGTPTYMAPEQIQGVLDTRTDQYAVGVLLYEMLAGRPPFVEEQAITLLMRHMQDAPPTLEGPLGEVVARMLAKDPNDRYPDVEAALRALERAVPVKGYTLLEIVVTAVLTSLILLMSVRFLIPTLRASVRGTLRVEMQQTAVVALNKLVADVERTTPPGLSVRSTAPPVAVGVCLLSSPELRAGQPGPLQPNGTLVWSKFFYLYYFDRASRQLRRREWPPGDPPATPAEVAITKARRLSPDRLGAILGQPGSAEMVLAGDVDSFEILYPPGGSDEQVIQPLRFRLTLTRNGNTGDARAQTFTCTRSACLRNQR